MAAWFRGYAWASAAPGTKQFYYWSVPVWQRSVASRAKESLYHWLYRRYLVSCTYFREDDAEIVFRKYERARCPVLVSFSRPLYELSRVLRARDLRPTPPRAIVVGGEKLYPFQRELIESTFEAPVFETYGCREFMLVAAECDERSHLHLTSEQLVTEILDDDGRPVPAGRAGRLVVTDLYNVGAPLIRYDTGDPCGCKRRPLSLRPRPSAARRDIGRSLETIVTSDRRLVPGEVFPMVFKDVTAVARYQGIQDAPDRLLIRVQLRADWPVDARRAALGDLQKVLGDKIRVDLEVVDALEETPAGKLQVVRNPWLARQRQLEHQEGGARA